MAAISRRGEPVAGSSSSGSRVTGLVLVAGSCVLLLVGVANFFGVRNFTVATRSWSIDFDINWIAARQLVAGRSLYDRHEALLRGLHEIGPQMRGTNFATFWSYLGSPPVALSHVPFLPFGHDAGLDLFRVGTFAAMVAAVVIVARSLPPGSRLPAALVGIGAMLFAYPTIKTIELGQGNGWVMLALAVGIWSCTRERWTLAGVSFGVATVLKISPGLLVVYLLLRGHRRAAWSSLATAVAWFGCAALLGRATDLTTWVTDIAPRVSRATVSSYNQSLVGAASRLTTSLDFASGRSDGSWYLLGYAVAASGVLGLWWWRRRRPLDVLELGAIVLVALLAGPLTWDHYVTWAFLPLVLLVDPSRWRNLHRFHAAALGGAIAAAVWLLHSDVSLVSKLEVQHDWWQRLASDRYTAAVLLLLGAAVAMLGRMPVQRASEPAEAAELDQLAVVGADIPA